VHKVWLPVGAGHKLLLLCPLLLRSWASTQQAYQQGKCIVSHVPVELGLGSSQVGLRSADVVRLENIPHYR